MKLRMASPSDAPAMLGIYGQCIGTSITFELVLPSMEDFAGRVVSVLAEHPWIVCTEDSGEVIGYAYAHRLMGRGAYRWSAELSVYVDEGHRGMGAAHALYGALLDILKLQNVVNVFACVTVPNRPSESFHRSMGFQEVGRFCQAGYKAGGWHDVVWFETEINPRIDDPDDVVFLPELDPDAVDACLQRAEQKAGWSCPEH